MKNSSRQHESYASTSIPYIDAKVAAALCKGCVCAYILDELSGITDEWLLAHVTPNMVGRGFDQVVCLVLARAMLW